MYYNNIQSNGKLEANNVTADQYNVSKVYINPNFNRQAVLSNMPIHKSAVHINPKFKHQAPISQNVNSNSKVYINPYFLKRNTVLNAKDQTESSYKLEDTYANNNSTNNQTVPLKDKLPCPISKSKYSLVRNNQSNVKVTEVRQNNNKNTITIQINKYKSVSISDIKRSDALNLNKSLVKRLSVKNELLVQKYKKYTHQNCCKNKYKLIKLNKQVTDIVNGTKQTPTKQKSESRKIHLKHTPSNYRKNNIPCPLFRKYGKCLRKVKGKCNYVHDRKHVAVCRKFLNGNCHDSDCLLAHDSTSNKMPTCYFYLKGMCSKDGCPYLHVKLNEKTQICSDFSKGYCENGDKCLKRHVDASEILKKRKRELQLKNKMNRCKYGTKYQASSQRTVTPSKVNVKKISCKSNEPEKKQKPEEDGTDSRYYNKEVVGTDDSNDKCHMIKPSRCKLGTLPSFIKL